MPKRWLIGRVIVRSSLFLLLAVLINIAVAWGCVCWSPVQRNAQLDVGDWLAPAPSHWTGTVRSAVVSGFGLTTAHSAIAGGPQKQQWAIIAGWPLRCFFYERHRTAQNASMAMLAPYAGPTSWREGLTIPQWIPWCSRERPGWGNINGIPEVCYLPVRPLWNGLIGNVLFYTVLLWSMSLAAGALFRLWRRHRRLCEHCGYPRGTSPVCTECGAGLPSRELLSDRLLQRAASPQFLRTVRKRVLVCIPLGAVVQYLIAVGFSLGGSFGKTDRSWVLREDQSDWTNALWVFEATSIGKDVLTARYWTPPKSFAGHPDKTLDPDWKFCNWINWTWPRSTEPFPLPAWSSLGQVHTDLADEFYPDSSLWRGYLSVGCGWPMRSTSYFAAASTTPGPFLVRDGLVIANTPIADTSPNEHSTPRVIPLRLYWPATIVNTLAYATILLMLFTLLPGIRVYLRRRAAPQ